jgi:hypothetical protein
MKTLVDWAAMRVSAEQFLDSFQDSIMAGHHRCQDFYTLDFILIGASNALLRLVPKLRRELTEDLITAAAFLRLVIDVVLSIYAFHHFDDSEVLAQHLMNGGELSEKKSRTGVKMTHSFLSREFEKQFLYSHDVYKNACKGIHFSNFHIFAHTNLEGRKIKMRVTPLGVLPTERQADEIIITTAALYGVYLAMLQNNEESKTRAAEKRKAQKT